MSNKEFETNGSRRSIKIRKRKKNKKRIIIASLLAIILLLVGPFTFRVVKQYINFSKNLNPNTGQEATVSDVQTKPFAVLIMGVGTNGNDGEAENADAIMLAVINPKLKAAELISIPRDNYLPRGAQCESAGYYDKITHSGADSACLESTLEELFDLDINYYVSVNFKGFVDIVDSINGVQMFVPDLRDGFNAWSGSAADDTLVDPSLQNGDQWCEHDSNRTPYAVCFTEFGEQTVDGEHALALARSRHYDSDFDRSNRQNELIKAILNKVMSPSGLMSLDKLLDAVSGNVATNIPQSQFLDFAKLAKSLFSSNDSNSLAIRSTQLQGLSGTFEGDISGRLSYNVVPIKSIENIRQRIAGLLDGQPVDIDPITFDFEEANQNPYIPYFGGPFLGHDGYGLEDIQRFRTSSAAPAAISIKKYN